MIQREPLVLIKCSKKRYKILSHRILQYWEISPIGQIKGKLLKDTQASVCMLHWASDICKTKKILFGNDTLFKWKDKKNRRCLLSFFITVCLPI
jgi:hypothetical protein